MADDRYTKQNAVRQVLDYYLPSPHEEALGKRAEALDRAKAECAAAYRRMAAKVESLTIADVFPNAKSGGDHG